MVHIARFYTSVCNYLIRSNFWHNFSEYQNIIGRTKKGHRKVSNAYNLQSYESSMPLEIASSPESLESIWVSKILLL